MADEKHTPGPWKVSVTEGFIGPQGDGQHVIHVHVLGTRTTANGTPHAVASIPYNTKLSFDERMKDAQLIAAAPDMLDVLLTVNIAFRDDAPYLERLSALMDVEKVIRKARGTKDEE